MLCENCNNNIATTHIKTVINGKVIEKNLCTECAAKLGIESNFGGALSEMLTSIFGDSAKASLHPSNAKRCSCCNSTFSDIAKSGKLGCSECYQTFFDELLPYLKRVHGSVRHIGKIPNSLSKNDENKDLPQNDPIAQMKLELKELILQEKFEEAAVLRDKIKAKEETQK